MKKIALTTMALLALFLGAGCSSNGNGDSGSDDTSTEKTEDSKKEEALPSEVTIADGSSTDAAPTDKVYMRQLLTAPHGTKSFAVVTVTMSAETILGVNLDEFQYVSPADFDSVPNADGGFGEAFPDDTVLASKRENNDAYSKMMAEKGGATQTWDDSINAISEFAKGKTASELEEAVTELNDQGEDGNPSDVVSGATFSDTAGYLQAIIDSATKGMIYEGIKTDNADLKEIQVLASPHGDKSFAVITVGLDGDQLAVAALDEFQYVSAADFGGVPNSNDEFGADVKDGLVLASKEANNDAYSKMMSEKGGATNTYSDNLAAVIQFALGKTSGELEATVGELKGLGEDDSPADVVSGATFSDTAGYLQAIVDAIKAAE